MDGVHRIVLSLLTSGELLFQTFDRLRLFFVLVVSIHNRRVQQHFPRLFIHIAAAVDQGGGGSVEGLVPEPVQKALRARLT